MIMYQILDLQNYVDYKLDKKTFQRFIHRFMVKLDHPLLF